MTIINRLANATFKLVHSHRALKLLALNRETKQSFTIKITWIASYLQKIRESVMQQK